MGFYKTSAKAALDAWDNEILQRAELKEKSLEFAKNSVANRYFTVMLQISTFTVCHSMSRHLLDIAVSGRFPVLRMVIPASPVVRPVFPVSAARNISSCWMHGVTVAPRKESQGSLTGKHWVLNGEC